MYLLIDNYDSFTYNLYQAFASEGVRPLVKRNDDITLEEIASLRPDKIIISPGPGTPEQTGISNGAILEFGRSVPILGICLGHQCIVSVFGGRIERVKRIIHGATTPVEHDGKEIFRGVPSPFEAARYHSLQTENLPDCLRVTARTTDGIIMAVTHTRNPLTGLQFHPESFMTEHGQRLIRNFIEM
ncbi:MAG: anthranilate/aminodeoxychorismate synthase component II [Candidatus Omnitrophica bacterium]|nr:anthranilate/aminodeoxychorismate synthase component II [Candidatus Omnitrophota bacterium]